MPRVNPKAPSSPASLREFIRENESLVYCFCLLMLHDKQETESVFLETVREFGEFYRRRHHKKTPAELKVHLFSIAWKLVSETDPEDQMRWLNGRDTRKMNDWNKDLLTPWIKTHEITDTLKIGLVNRVQLLNSEFKAPLILKDFLHFEDEEILQILGSRWGVYRHRLHRGRIDLLQGLKGQSFEAGATQ